MDTNLPQSPAAIAAELLPLSAAYAPTPLLDLPGLAARLGVAQILAKDEGRRALGSFKSLGGTYAGLRALVVVEPDRVACVGAALAASRPVRLSGALDTAAEMLSCGEASAPALAILQRCGARTIAVSEAELHAAPGVLRAAGGPATTASGAAGLAGFMRAMGGAPAFSLDDTSVVLVLVTEGDIQ